MTTDDLEEHYISENVSALGGSTGDADAVGALRDDESDATNRPPPSAPK
ncbi:MAG: hypothetical protein ACLT4Y_11205 [Bifidobacterium breve]